jgi:hypothetical protein
VPIFLLSVSLERRAATASPSVCIEDRKGPSGTLSGEWSAGRHREPVMRELLPDLCRRHGLERIDSLKMTVEVERRPRSTDDGDKRYSALCVPCHEFLGCRRASG